MPKVQGRLTIRRRPKDGTPGTPGADSLRYWIQPSATAVAMTSPESGDATPIPERVTVEVWKQIGNNTPTIINIESEGLSLDYAFTRNGVAGKIAPFKKDLTVSIPTNTEYNNIIIRLSRTNTILDSVTIPFIYDGEQGTPGKDGVSYSVVITPNNITIKYDGTIICDSDNINAVAYKNVGGKISEADDGSMKLVCTKMDGTKSEISASGITSNGVKTYAGVSFEYRVKEETVASSALVINREGEKGDQGIQGCIYRITQWQSGITYRFDGGSTSTGLRYIDIAVIPNPSLAAKATAYQCKQTHTSSDSNSPTSANKNTYWTELNAQAPIYTPLLVADNAVITLLNSNQILVMKDDGSTVNAALGGGKYPLWIGNPDPTQANFYVDDEGRAHMTEAEILGKIIAGVENGQRVELQPDNKSMKIYDASGNEVSSFEGNSYTDIAKLFSSSSGSFTIKTRTKTEYNYASGVTLGKGYASISGNDSYTNSLSQSVIISNSVYSATPIEVSATGYLKTYFTPGAELADTGSSSDSSSSSTQSSKPTFMKNASALIYLYVDTYSDSALTTKLGSTLIAVCGSQNGDKQFSALKARTSYGGYHVLRIQISISASGSGMSANVSWGSYTSGKSDISASYVSDFYVSRYFANGFCLGLSQTNYIWAYNQGTNGMRFVMENSGYGIDISKSGIKHKHHGGNWCSMPMFVFKAEYYCYKSGDNIYYTSRNIKSFDGSSPTATRQSEGVIRLTIPSTWSSKLTIDIQHLIVNVVGYGTIYNGTNANKAAIKSITSSYIDVTLSDDASCNDGQFLISIMYIDI